MFNLNLIEKIDPLQKDEDNYKVPLNEKLLDIVSRYNGEVLSITIQARNATYALEKADLHFEAFLDFYHSLLTVLVQDIINFITALILDCSILKQKTFFYLLMMMLKMVDMIYLTMILQKTILVN